MRRAIVGAVVAAGLWAGQAAADENLVWNGDFADGLSGWTATGGVSTVQESALLADSGSANALYQAILVDLVTYQLEFDFRNLLDATYAQGTFPDTFFASVYFTDNPAAFAPGGPSVALFDMDYAGIFNLGGSVGPSPIGADWLHYSGQMLAQDSYLIPYFEVHNLDFGPGDSAVLVDNVKLMVPEPGTAVLAALGALVTWACRRRSRAVAGPPPPRSSSPTA